VKEITLNDNEWDCTLLPGNVIVTARNEQLKNKELVNKAEELSIYVSSQMHRK